MRNLSKKPDDRAESGRAFGRALLEAAMTSGLSAQDILARPSLGGRASPGSVQMPSMLRTKQLTLEPGGERRTGTGTEISEPGVASTKTVVETPEGTQVASGSESRAPAREEGRTVIRTEMSDPLTEPPGVATAKWVPPSSSLAARATLSSGRPTPPPSKPPSSVDATLADEQPPTMPPQQPAPPRGPNAFVIAGLAVGVVVVAAIAYRAGSGPVVDRTPGGPVVAGAPHAVQPLQPRDEEPGALTAAQSASSATHSALAVQADPLPPLVNVANARSSPAGSASSGGRSVVSVETSSARPGVGEPVDLTARVTGSGGVRPKIEGPKFRITGPGIVAGTELAAMDDGTGALRTTFTFLQPGRFEVGFSARADGAAVRSVRVLVVGDPSAPAPVQAPAGPAPAPAPGPPAAKWL
jgi:hypothetical protein